MIKSFLGCLDPEGGKQQFDRIWSDRAYQGSCGRLGIEASLDACHSYRIAFIGSTPAARRAGKAQAARATSPRTKVDASSSSGSRELSSDQWAITWLSASVRMIPTAIPPPTLAS